MTFTRTRLTWQAYLTIGYYSYLLNVLGPISLFLRDEMNLSYTVTGLHHSAYALGIIVTGLLMNRAVQRAGARVMVWVGVFGMALGTLLLLVGRHPAVTVLGAFCMGLLGVLIASLLNASLAEQHGEYRAVAMVESTIFASILSTLAPLAVGFFARTPLTYRAAPALMLAAAPLLFLVFRRNVLRFQAAPRSAGKRGPLPAAYWRFWALIFLIVSVEFCIIFWAADYLEKVTGLSNANAAFGLSAFLAANVLGRLLVSRLLLRSHEYRILMAAFAVAIGGFLVFWISPWPALTIAGLMITGAGISALFPIVNALTLASVPDRMVEATGLLTLAIGLAILLLPMALAQLADRFGIRAAYGLELALLLLAAGLAFRRRAPAEPAGTLPA